MSTFLPDSCLGCSACEVACPVVASDGRFAGPKVLGPALIRKLEGGWPGEPSLSPAEAGVLGADLCLQCHQCDLACPAGVAVSTLTRKAKALAGSIPRSRYQTFVDRLMVNPEGLGRLALAGGIGRRLVRRASMRVAVGLERTSLSLLGFSPSRALPPPVSQSLTSWLARNRLSPSVTAGRPPVILFAGCYARYYDPAAAKSAVSVLQSAGFRVVIPHEVCCGSPALGSGNEEAAAAAALSNLRLLRNTSERLGQDVPILTPCPSCALSLRETLPELIGGEEAGTLSRQVWDLGEFLAGPAQAAITRRFDTASGSVAGLTWAYHSPCHLRALGVGQPLTDLLRDLGLGRPVDPGPAAAGCCGMGGVSGLSRPGYVRSLAAGARVLEVYSGLAREATQPLLLSECPLCRWQISDLSGLSAAHPVELLTHALTSRPPRDPRWEGKGAYR